MQMMIKGIPVTLYVKTQTGTDPFNRPIYEETAVTVENVLVGEPSSEDITNELNLSGKVISYVLAIPKSDTHDWENASVLLYGKRYRTIGTPTQGIEENIPLAWNKKVRVERYVGQD